MKYTRWSVFETTATALFTNEDFPHLRGEIIAVLVCDNLSIYERYLHSHFFCKLNKIISTIYGQVLRIKLDELGAQYSMEADEKFITVNVRLKPDHQLRFCVRSEQAREMADKVEGLIAAANLLNGEYWTTGMRIV